jgi:hypothetical protein
MARRAHLRLFYQRRTLIQGIYSWRIQVGGGSSQVLSKIGREVRGKRENSRKCLYYYEILVAFPRYPPRTGICKYRFEYYEKPECKCWFESCETQLIEELRGVSRSDNFEYFFGHVLQGTRILKGGVLPLSMGVDIHGWWLIAGIINLLMRLSVWPSKIFCRLEIFFGARATSAANFC